MAVAGANSSSSELAPRLSPKAPKHLLHLLEEFDEGVRVDAPATALRALKQSFTLLLGFSCDLLGAACVELGASAELYLQPEGGTSRLADCENRLKEALYFLSQRFDEAFCKRFALLFFDAEGNQKQFYLLTQGGKVEGKLGGLDRISDFCKDWRRAPGRGEAFKLRNAYLPHLEAWIHSLNTLLEDAEVLWEHTDLEGVQQIAYRIDGRQIVVGRRIDLSGCKACIPSRVLQAPAEWVKGEGFVGLPQEVPEHALHLLDRFAAALIGNDIIESTRLLRDTLEFLLRYFAGVGLQLCRELECITADVQKFAKSTQDVDSCERLLQSAVEALKAHQGDAGAKDFVGVFYRRDSNLELQPRSHTNILLLEGVISSWFKQERGQTPEASRYAKDFDRYFPLFRDWVGSMGAYFSHTEHFSEPPSDDGILPLTVRCSDHLLELQKPDYLLRIRQCPVCLPHPAWLREAAKEQKEKVAAPKLSAEQLLRRANTAAQEQPLPEVPEKAPEPPPALVAAPGEFRPLLIPDDGPKFFNRLLRRLDVRIRRGELADSCAALRDSLEYLLRYWTGVIYIACRDAALLSLDEEESIASSDLTIQGCEALLLSCLDKLSSHTGEFTEEIIQVYYNRDLFTEKLKPIGAHTRVLLTDASAENQMKLLAEFCEADGSQDAYRARRDLKTFLPVLRDWVQRSTAFFEQCQHHEEEPEKDGRMELVVQWDTRFVELVAPYYTFKVRLGSDAVPDLPVPEWIEPLEGKSEDDAPKPKVITTEELALSEPFLIHKVQYVGEQPNSHGVTCKSGVISIQNAGGGSLTGRAFSNHPCIEVTPNRFRDKTTLQYWLDEKSLPRDFVPFLVLRSGGDERQVTLAELRPLSRMNTLTKGQGRVFLFAPAVVGFFVVNGVAVRQAKLIATDIEGIQKGTGKLKEIAPEALQAAQAHGSWVGGLYLLYPAVAPLAAWWVFRKFSHSLQDLLQKYFLRALLAPLVLAVVTGVLNSLIFASLRHPEIGNANLLALVPWALFFSAGGATYAYLESEHKFAEWVSDPILRKLIPFCASAIFVTLWTLALY